MPIETVYFLGAGGHAKVAIDALLRGRVEKIDIRVLDDDPERQGCEILGFTIHPAVAISPGIKFHVAIGDNVTRSRRFDEVARRGANPLTIAHPISAVAASARIDAGAFIAAFSTVGPDSVAGRGCIVNHGAVVDHDCILGEFCHIAPGSILGGGVTIGERVLVGAGATILAGVTVASDVVIGAGAVVVRSIHQAGTFVGVPAREILRG